MQIELFISSAQLVPRTRCSRILGWVRLESFEVNTPDCDAAQRCNAWQRSHVRGCGRRLVVQSVCAHAAPFLPEWHESVRFQVVSELARHGTAKPARRRIGAERRCRESASDSPFRSALRRVGPARRRTAAATPLDAPARIAGCAPLRGRGLRR